MFHLLLCAQFLWSKLLCTARCIQTMKLADWLSDCVLKLGWELAFGLHKTCFRISIMRWNHETSLSGGLHRKQTEMETSEKDSDEECSQDDLLWGQGSKRSGAVAQSQALAGPAGHSGADSTAGGVWAGTGPLQPVTQSLMQVPCTVSLTLFSWGQGSLRGRLLWALSHQCSRELGESVLILTGASGQWRGSITTTTKVLYFLWLSGTTTKNLW